MTDSNCEWPAFFYFSGCNKTKLKMNPTYMQLNFKSFKSSIMYVWNNHETQSSSVCMILMYNIGCVHGLLVLYLKV